MQLRLNSWAEDLDLSVCNHQTLISSDQREGGGTSSRGRLLATESIARYGEGPPQSRVSLRNSDPSMITSAPSRENSATGGTCSIVGSCAELNGSIRSAAASKHADSLLLGSRQPRMMFSSAVSGASADHERSGWSPARCYACSFCGREFNSAQALGGHMNIHRRDRARLRTSTSPGASTAQMDQSDLSLIPQNNLQYLHANTPYDQSFFNESAPTCRDNPANIAANSSSFNVTYKTPDISSTTAPTFSLLANIHPAPPDPTLLSLTAYPSRQESPTPPFSMPLVDLAPMIINSSARSSSSVLKFPKAEREAHSFSSSISPHASLLVRPREESVPSLKHEEALNTIAGHASASWQIRPNCGAATMAQLNQLSQFKGRAKRAREDDVADGVPAKTTAGQSCRHDSSSAERSHVSQLHTTDARPSKANGKGLLFLDLELRLGQSSPSDS